MKKLIAFTLFFLLFASFVGCTTPVEDSSADRSVPDPTVTGNMSYVYYFYYRISGHETREGKISAEWEQKLVTALSGLKKTGKKQEKCEGRRNHILCIQTGDTIYRYTEGILSLVTEHKGEGEILEISTELKSLLSNFAMYYPYNTYQASYNKGELSEFKHVFEAESTTDFTIKDLTVQTSGEGFEARTSGAIEFVVTSTTAKTIVVQLKTPSPIGDLYVEQPINKTITVATGVPTRIGFSRQASSFTLNLIADNTLYKIVVSQ